jgi:hypothetical protein
MHASDILAAGLIVLAAVLLIRIEVSSRRNTVRMVREEKSSLPEPGPCTADYERTETPSKTRFAA